MPDGYSPKRVSAERITERRDAIIGAIERCLEVWHYYTRVYAQQAAERPVGDWVDVMRGNHAAWAAGYALAVSRIAKQYGKDHSHPLTDAGLAAAFGVPMRAMVGRADELASAHACDMVRAECALDALVGRYSLTLKRLMDDLEGVPTPSGTWPWDGDTYTDGEFIARESPAIFAYYGALEVLEGEDDGRSHQHALECVLALDPDHYDTYLVLRDYLSRCGQRPTGVKFEDIAYRRCIARITMPDGKWPEQMPYGVLENRPIHRTLISKAATLWRKKQTDEALDILRRLLRMDPENRTAAAEHILAIRMGMTPARFDDQFHGDGVDALVMMRWFSTNGGQFDDEFEEWQHRLSVLYPEDFPEEDEDDDDEDDEPVAFDAPEDPFRSPGETVH